MNKQTKPMIVKQYKAALREETYMERDREVLDEADLKAAINSWK